MKKNKYEIKYEALLNGVLMLQIESKEKTIMYVNAKKERRSERE